MARRRFWQSGLRGRDAAAQSRPRNEAMHPFASVLRAAPKIVAVGRNYAKHAAEMGTVAPETPLLFLKAPSSLVGPGDPVKLPLDIGEIHHEVERASPARVAHLPARPG